MNISVKKNTMKKLTVICLAGASVFSITACSFSPIKAKPIASYTLTAQYMALVPAKQRSTKVILVAAPTASPGYTNEKMVYFERSYQLNNYVANRWVDTPAKMLSPLIVQALNASHYFKAVVSQPYTSKTELRLDTEVLTLAQDFSKQPSVMRLAVRARLNNEISHQVLATQDFTIEAPAKEDNPYAGVIAANRAVSRLLPELVDFCISNSEEKQDGDRHKVKG